MKIESLKLENFSKYSQVEVDFNENVTYLVGNNGAGKSTLGITAIWAAFEGVAERSKSALIGERFRFIGPDGSSANIHLTLIDENNGARIKVMRKITKSGNEIKFEAPEGMELDQKWLSDLFNVFLIAPKKFIELSGKEQAMVLGIDTSDIDAEIDSLKSEYTLLNREYKNLGNPDPVEEVSPVDVGELNRQKNEILAFNVEQDGKQKKIDDAAKILNELEQERIELEEKLKAIKQRIEKGKEYISSLDEPLPKKSVADIDEQINGANEINDKALAWRQYCDLLKKKELKKRELDANKVMQKQKEEEKLEVIKSKEFPFEGMSVNDKGELLINNRPVKPPYFSSGELLRIVPILISTQNPELKYVFIQEFNLLDEKTQKEVEEYLTKKGFQLVIEVVGDKKIKDRNCILLKDCEVVEDNVESEKDLFS